MSRQPGSHRLAFAALACETGAVRKVATMGVSKIVRPGRAVEATLLCLPRGAGAGEPRKGESDRAAARPSFLMALMETDNGGSHQRRESMDAFYEQEGQSKRIRSSLSIRRICSNGGLTQGKHLTTAWPLLSLTRLSAKTVGRLSKRWRFHCLSTLGCTWASLATSLRVRLPLTTSRANVALKSAE